jgi:hypothetical protein
MTSRILIPGFVAVASHPLPLANLSCKPTKSNLKAMNPKVMNPKVMNPGTRG